MKGPPARGGRAERGAAGWRLRGPLRAPVPLALPPPSLRAPRHSILDLHLAYSNPHS